MKRCTWVVCTVILSAGLSFASVVSDFNTSGTDGWTVYNDSSIQNSLDTANGDIPSPGGGLFNGYLWGMDTVGGTRIFDAPSKFHGDFYGQTLSFDYIVGKTVSSSANINSDLSHVRVTDGTTTLVINLADSTPWPDLGVWQNLSVILDESETQGSGWYKLTSNSYDGNGGNVFNDGVAATAAEIQTVFSNITGLRLGSEVIGNLSSSEEYIAIDNVSIVPEPTSLGMLALGVLGVVRKRNKR